MRYAPARAGRPCPFLAAAEYVNNFEALNELEFTDCLRLSVVDVDILKPDTGALQIERPLHTSSRGTSSSERQGSSGDLTPDPSGRAYAEPVSEGEEDEDMDLAPGAFAVSPSTVSSDVISVLFSKE